MVHFDKSLWEEYIKGITPLKKEERILLSPQKKLSFCLPEKCPHTSYTARFIATACNYHDEKKHSKKKANSFQFQASLDLHGLCEASAYKKLTEFLQKMHYFHIKRVLIITGKSGILFQNVPKWLSTLSASVKNVAYANPCHGGTGALYVTLSS